MLGGTDLQKEIRKVVKVQIKPDRRNHLEVVFSRGRDLLSTYARDSGKRLVLM